MQSIGRSADHLPHTENASLDLSSGGGIVLPRFLRKPVRQIRRLMNGGFRVSKRGLMVFGLSFALAAGVAGFFAGGENEKVIGSIAPSLGIAIKKYDISGNFEVSDMDVVSLLTPQYGQSILSYDVDAARNALKENPWIAEAAVSKVYPDKLSIKIEERVAHALWQNENGLQLIDREGRVLAQFDGRANSLPLVVGKGAEKDAANVISLLQRVPDLAVQTKALIRVGDRRWDIELADGTLLMLPENDFGAELFRFAQLEQANGILDRDVIRVDLRFPDRIVVKMSSQAAELIRAKREEQIKAVNDATKERNI